LSGKYLQLESLGSGKCTGTFLYKQHTGVSDRILKNTEVVYRAVVYNFWVPGCPSDYILCNSASY